MASIIKLHTGKFVRLIVTAIGTTFLATMNLTYSEGIAAEPLDGALDILSLTERSTRIDLGVSADLIIAHPGQRKSFLVSNRNKQIFEINFGSDGRPTAKKLATFSGSIMSATVDSNGKFLYAAGNDDDFHGGKILHSERDETLALHEAIANLLSIQTVGFLLRINLDNGSSNTALIEDSFVKPTIALKEDDQILVSDSASGVVLVFPTSELFEREGDLRVLSTKTFFANIDPEKSIYVGDGGVVDLVPFTRQPWLIVAQRANPRLAIFDIVTRSRLESPAIAIDASVSKPSRIVIADQGNSLISLDARPPYSLSLYDFDLGRDNITPIATANLAGRLGDSNNSSIGQKTKSVELILSAKGGRIIAGYRSGRILTMYKRHHNSIERTNIFRFDRPIRDAVLAHDGQSLIVAQSESTDVVIVDRLDSWMEATRGYAGRVDLREAQRLLATVLAADARYRPNTVDGFFGEETRKAMRAFEVYAGVRMPQDLVGISGQDSAIKSVLTWKRENPLRSKAHFERRNIQIKAGIEAAKNEPVTIERAFRLGLPRDPDLLRDVGKLSKKCEQDTAVAFIPTKPSGNESPDGMLVLVICEPKLESESTNSVQVDFYRMLLNTKFTYLSSGIAKCKYLVDHFPNLNSTHCSSKKK